MLTERDKVMSVVSTMTNDDILRLQVILARDFSSAWKNTKNTYNSATIQALENVKAGKNLSKAFNSIDELMEELNA